MIATCHALPQSAAQDLLQGAARKLCHRPEDSPTQRDARTHRMVHSALGFEPRDAIEYMLSTLAFAHFELILDAMHDVFEGQLEGVKLRTKSNIVALDRALLAIVKEFRTVRDRPLAAEATQPQAAAAAEVPQPAPPAESRTEPAAFPAGASRPDSTPAASSESPPPPAASPIQARPAAPFPGPGLAPDEATPAEHLAAFQQALAALEETLEENRTRHTQIAHARADAAD